VVSASAARVGRYYTAARRHPWVLGKVADWRIPLGPYTPAQIVFAVVGGFFLVKTISWWSWMGPIPVAAWVLAVWAVRRPTIKGRAPMQAAVGWLLLAWQPHGGRIGGRPARDRAARPWVGGFVIEDAAWVPAITPRARAPGRGSAQRPSVRKHSVAVARTQPARPVSGVQHLLALAEQGGGVR
jgi:hypothetical protein